MCVLLIYDSIEYTHGVSCPLKKEKKTGRDGEPVKLMDQLIGKTIFMIIVSDIKLSQQ